MSDRRVVNVGGTTFKVARRYTELKAIGRGSYGVVCSSADTERQRKVAIKRIRPMAAHTADAKHVLREVRLMRLLGAHDNVISMFDVFCNERDDELYIVMELLDSDLHRIIQSPQPLTDAHHRYFMYQLVRGVGYLHKHNIIHRDLKPGNLLVTRNCELRITDFGLAREKPESEANVEGEEGDGELHPMTQHVVTRWYRPPELMLTPDGLYTDAVDMWSVGCILGELLGRQPLFPGKNFVHQLQLIFGVIGAPPDAETRRVRNRQARKFLESVRTKQKIPFTKVYTSAPSAAHELLESLLLFEPSMRLTAAASLGQRYFANLSYARDAPPDPPVATDCDFSFERANHSRAQLKRMIVEEVDAFHKAATRGHARAQSARAPAQRQPAQEQRKEPAAAAKRPASAPRQRPERSASSSAALNGSSPKRPAGIDYTGAVPADAESRLSPSAALSPTKRAAVAAADRKGREQKRVASPQSPFNKDVAGAPASPTQRAALAAAERRRQEPRHETGADEPPLDAATRARALSFGAADRPNEQAATDLSAATGTTSSRPASAWPAQSSGPAQRRTSTSASARHAPADDDSDGLSPYGHGGDGGGAARRPSGDADRQMDHPRSASEMLLRNRAQSASDSVLGGGPTATAVSKGAPAGTGGPPAPAAEDRYRPYNGSTHGLVSEGAAGLHAGRARPTSAARDAELTRAYGNSGGAAAVAQASGAAVPRPRAASAPRAGRPPVRASAIPDESSYLSGVSGASGASALVGAARVGVAPPVANTATAAPQRLQSQQPNPRKTTARTVSQKKLTVPRSPNFSKRLNRKA